MGFQQGLSGLNSAAKQLDVIGNNVANSSTVGFKQAQAQFADMYAASLSGGGALQVGTGSKVAAVAQQFTQGNITNTSNPLDTAISGQGFFRMIDASGSISYTRNGQFQVDKNGYVVSNQGHRLSGYMPDALGAIIPGQPLPILINTANLSPQQTVNVTVGANLDSRSAVPVNPNFMLSDSSSYNDSTPVTIYDSLGGSHVGSLYFQRQPVSGAALAALGSFSIPLASSTMTTTGTTAGLSAGDTVTLNAVTYTILSVDSPTQLTVQPTASVAVAAPGMGLSATSAPSADWNVYLAIDGALVPPALTPLTVLTFDTLGQLASTAPVSTPLGTITSAIFTPTGSAAQTVTFDFAETSQYGGSFGINSLVQDGYSSGRLSGFNASPDGTIMGRYTNGQSRALGQVLLANFTNPQGLQPLGNNEWVESASSGGPTLGVPGSSSMGVLQSSAVEDSNVDLTAELVNMITAQRVYQANAQSIKTQDAVLQTLVNLR